MSKNYIRREYDEVSEEVEYYLSDSHYDVMLLNWPMKKANVYRETDGLGAYFEANHVDLRLI